MYSSYGPPPLRPKLVSREISLFHYIFLRIRDLLWLRVERLLTSQLFLETSELFSKTKAVIVTRILQCGVVLSMETSGKLSFFLPYKEITASYAFSRNCVCIKYGIRA